MFFFQYKDTGQKPVLRTDSVNVSPEKQKKHKEHKEQKQEKHTESSKKTSPTKAKVVVVEKTRVEKPTTTSSSDSYKTPEDSTNSSEKSQNVITREESRHTEASEEVIKSVRNIDEQQADEITVNSLNECWSQLESIAIKNYD